MAYYKYCELGFEDKEILTAWPSIKITQQDSIASKYSFLKGRKLEETNENLSNLSKSLHSCSEKDNNEESFDSRKSLTKKNRSPFDTHLKNVNLEVVPELDLVHEFSHVPKSHETALLNQINIKNLGKDSLYGTVLTHKEKAKNVFEDCKKDQELKDLSAAFMAIKQVLFLNFMQFILTFVVYPNYCFELNLGTQSGWKYPLTTMVFAIFDFAGKI